MVSKAAPPKAVKLALSSAPLFCVSTMWATDDLFLGYILPESPLLSSIILQITLWWSPYLLHLPFCILPLLCLFILFDLLFCSVSFSYFLPLSPLTLSLSCPLLPSCPPSHHTECGSMQTLHACFFIPLSRVVRSAALDIGTSTCLVRLLFALRGVFSNSSFSQPCRHITPLCVPAYVSVFGNALTLLRPVNLSTVCAHF